ncbi:MAG TPA: hypothetical protein VEI97_01975, partial [bacterium]|nr:hypothetical protein [bacterium]
ALEVQLAQAQEAILTMQMRERELTDALNALAAATPRKGQPIEVKAQVRFIGTVTSKGTL